jgi:hypothetical protein
VVGDAVQDGGNRLARFVMETKDDAKVVEEIYLSVFGRYPTKEETATGVGAVAGAVADHRLLVEQHAEKKAKYEAYAKTLDERQAKWESDLLTQKPTAWTNFKIAKATSKSGATPGAADKASKIEIRDDGSLFASGSLEQVDTYTVTAELKVAKPVTAIRLEALTDPKLPSKGPGRAENGNFVLHEFKATSRPSGKKDEKPKPVKFERPTATVEQGGYAVAGTIDNNPATGWAIANGVGADQAALFHTSLNAANGLDVVFTFDQRYGSGHTLGRFRLSYTTDAKPRLTAPVTPELAMMLETPPAERSEAVAKELRARYLAQDQEHAKLKADAEKVPPADARVLGAQDLTWALLNNPAFLFNR